MEKNSVKNGFGQMGKVLTKCGLTPRTEQICLSLPQELVVDVVTALTLTLVMPSYYILVKVIQFGEETTVIALQVLNGNLFVKQ